MAYALLANHPTTPHRHIAHLLLSYHLAHSIGHLLDRLNGYYFANLIRNFLHIALLHVVSNWYVINYRAGYHNRAVADLWWRLACNKTSNWMLITRVSGVRVHIALTRLMNRLGIARTGNGVLLNARFTHHAAHGLFYCNRLLHGAQAIAIVRFDDRLIVGFNNVPIVSFVNRFADGIFAGD
jgi:hypothetical protein